jgi:membrane protease subunit HflC
VAAAAVLVMLVGWRVFFVVDETQVAVVRTWGRASKPPVAQAGLCVKWPWQTVRRVDRRVRLLSLEGRERLTCDGEGVVVEPFVCWRVSSEAAERFLRSVGDDAVARSLLADLVWRVLDRELSQRPLADWLCPIGDREPAGEPPQLTIMARVAAICRSEAFTRFGIDLLDVQLRQFSRPERLTGDLLRLMKAAVNRQIGRGCLAVDLQRERLATDARRQADHILSEAEEQAARIRGDGRREAMKIGGEARLINSALTDYLLQLEGYRTMAVEGEPVGSSAATPEGPSPATRGGYPKIKPAPTGQVPTPNTAPAPRSGSTPVSRPG